MKNNKSIILTVVLFLLAAGLFAGGIVLIVKGVNLPARSDPFGDMDDFNSFASNSMTATMYYAFGSLLICAGFGMTIAAIVFCCVHSAAKAAKDNGVTLSGVIDEIKTGVVGKDVYCEYCGAKIEKGKTDCDHCGAGVKRNS